MMIRANDIKKSVLKQAFSGLLLNSSSFDILDSSKAVNEAIMLYKKAVANGTFKNDNVNRIKNPVLKDGPGSNWAIIQIGLICSIYNGDSINADEKKKKYTYLNSGYNYIGTKDVGFDSTIDYDNGIKIPFNNKSFKIAYKNSVLLCMEGGSAGKKIAIVNEDVCFGNKLCCFYPFGIDEKYLFYYLQSPQFLNQFTDGVSGLIGGVGSNKLKNMLIPIPPLSYQRELVRKIETIIPLIKELEIKEQTIEELDSSLKTDLQLSILKDAFEGKFKTNNLEDESASLLIELIKKQKNEAIKKKEIKQETSDIYVFKDQSGLPHDNWCRTNIGSLISLTSGNDLTANEYFKENKGIPYFTGASNIDNNGDLIINRFTSSKYKNSDKGDILFSCKGTIGKMAINTVGPCHIARQFMGIKTYIDPEFTIYFLMSVVGQLMKKAKSMIPGIDRNTLLTTEILLPPLSEQKRIVVLIKEAFNKLDEFVNEIRKDEEN